MATFKVTSSELQSVPLEDDDIRGDGKKKKFKPLSAMKRFFRQKKKKDEVVAVKAQSTTAIPVGTDDDDDDDDDDDGGFKSHQKPRTLGPAARSISEDSVFSPEVREAPIRPFPTTALSVESIPTSAFQNELLSKLQKRRSQYSDDDHDDGLPRSPVPPVTTIDVIMGGPLKPGTSKKSSNNRDSDQSLISVDSSENEEESLFTNNWKTSVPAKKSPNQRRTISSESDMDQLDFGDIQKTEVLNNKTAKDRILVKPKARKTNRQSRKKRDTTSPLTLPSLNEESPTRSRPDDLKTLEADALPQSTSLQSVLLPPDPTPLPSITPTSPQAGSDFKADMKLNLFAVNGSSKGEKLPTLPSPMTMSAAAVPMTSAPKVMTPTSPVSKTAPTQAHIPDVLTGKSQSSHGNNSDSTSSGVMATDKAGAFSSSYKGGDKVPSTVVGQLGQSQKGASEEKQSTDFKSRMSQFEMTKSHVPVAEASLKVSDPISNVSLSPKLRRQGRSKTLPGSTDEQVSPGVQRANSHRIQTSSSLDHPSEQPLSLAVKVTPPQTPIDPLPQASASNKRLENMKFSSLDSNSSDNPWKDMMRKKKDEHDETKPSDLSSTGAKSGQNWNQPKSVALPSSYLDKKRASVETISFKNRDITEQALKKGDNTSLDNSTKHPSADSSQARKESIEIDLTELKSIKNVVSSSQNDNKQSVLLPASHSTGDKIKSFSGLSASGSGFMPSVYKSVSAPGKDTVIKDTSSKDAVIKDANTVGNDKEEVTKPSSVFGSHFRGGSIKSPVKGTDGATGMPLRAESVKMPSSVSKSIGYKMSQSSVTPSSTSGINKSNKQQEFSKPDMQATPTDPPSTTPSSVHASVHATPSTASLPHSAHSVTSSLPNASSKSVPGVQPTKPSSSNFAFTPKPSSNPSVAKPATSPTSPPPPSASFGVKPASCAVKTLNVDLATNHPSSPSSSSSSSSIATSTSLPSNSNASSTPSTAASSGTQSRGRSLSAFTTSSVSQPQLSTTIPSISSRSTVDKSPAFKTGKPSEKPAPEEPRQEPPTNTPAWRANIGKNTVPKNEVKIEIIENSAPSSNLLSSSQNNSEILRKGSDKVKGSQSAKKNESSSDTNNLSVDKSSSNRSSKVMDMVKNFQNLKVTS